jgi:hypothetical protein
MNALEEYISDLNPSCWLNADHVNGYGVTQPSINADVNTWVDISGNGRNATKPTNINPTPIVTTPKFQTNTYGNCIRFTATDFTSLAIENLRTPSFNLFGGTGRTMIFVTLSSQFGTVQQGNTGNSGGAFQTAQNLGIMIIPDTTTLRPLLLSNNRFRNPLVNIVTQVFNGNDLKVYSQSSLSVLSITCNGFTPISVAVDYRLPYGNNAVSLGSRVYAYSGGGHIVDSFISGDCMEIILFDRVTSRAEISQVQTYLKLKYNI